MRRIMLWVGMSIILMLLAVPAYATSLPLQGVCEVRAKVLQVSEENVHEPISSRNPDGSLSKEYMDYVVVKMTIEIQEMLGAVEKAYEGIDNCGGQYRPGEKIELTVVRRQRDFVDPNLLLHVGDIIVGNIERIGGWPGGSDRPFDSFNMTNIRMDSK
jgi:hypothetical protein